MRVPLAALGFRRTAIHFCFCRQLVWQEYSEFSNSAVLISSAPGSGMNRGASRHIWPKFLRADISLCFCISFILQVCQFLVLAVKSG